MKLNILCLLTIAISLTVPTQGMIKESKKNFKIFKKLGRNFPFNTNQNIISGTSRYKNSQYTLSQEVFDYQQNDPQMKKIEKLKQHKNIFELGQKRNYTTLRNNPFKKSTGFFDVTTGWQGKSINSGIKIKAQDNNATLKTGKMYSRWTNITEPMLNKLYATKIPYSFNPAKKSSIYHSNLGYKKQGHPLEYNTRLFSTKVSPEAFNLALGGQAASLMNPEKFMILLKNDNVSIADSVKLECEREAQEASKLIGQIAHLPGFSLKSLDLKDQWKNKYGTGHYDESNIVFKDVLHPYIVDMIKDSFKKANVSFKVIVSLTDKWTAPATASLDLVDGVSYNYDGKSDTLTLIDLNGTINLYLNPNYWGKEVYPTSAACFENSSECLIAQSMIAHETIHLSQLHAIEILNLALYLGQIKKINNTDVEKCLKIMQRLHEYLADILPLADPLYAQAQLQAFGKNRKESPQHITTKFGHKLALRAIALFKIQNML